MLKYYLMEIFEPVLLLGALSSLVGVSAAAYYGHINLGFAFLAVVGSVMAQMAIDLMDDYQDYKIGIDKKTTKTKFSGGSELVVSGKVPYKHVFWIALSVTFIAALIGVYLALNTSMLILPLMVIGALCIFLYAQYFTHIPFLAEPMVMLGFSLIGVGSFIVAQGSAAGLGNALFAIVPSGVLCGLALLVNEVPDADVDKRYGRKHAVILLKNNKNVALYYLFFEFATYGIVLIGIFQAVLPLVFLLVLLTIPISFYVANGISQYKNPQKFEKYMGSNVLSAVAYMFLLVLAYFI